MNKNLEEIANEYVTQDNLSTAHPIAFVITENYKETVTDGEDYDGIIAYKDGDVFDFDTIEEACQYVLDNYDDIKTDDGIAEIDLDNYFTYVSYFENVRRQSNFTPQMFLTRSSIEEHMEANSHHYTMPKSQLIHASWRNPEMELFIRELYKHATVPYEKWNYEALRYYHANIMNKEES